MASIIKNRLKKLCEEDPSLSVLWAQWTFDEQLISKALSSVSQIFPHYSIHDSSHSNQIVTNIERILGEDSIKLLSATDLWLILEAAFCHDIGMVIPMDKIREDWDTPEFKTFLFTIATDSSHELHFIGKKYKGDNCQHVFHNAQWPLDAFEEVRLLLAEFYRRKHASRAEEIIRNPWKEISLNSPRNELLPTRLFKVMGKISSHHGYSFKDVMKLPRKAVGIGNDEANPRYIACLLRLGDLLDLDDNRFCPVMLKTAGALPCSTHAHIEKHMSIEHFRMDQNRIEVHALCETYAGYTATNSWFKYLEAEFNQQMMNWDNIVPNKNMGLLPTIGKLDIQLKDYELLSREGTPKFQIDEDKMFDLLQGAGVYQEPFQCIREILQNAVDATLLKLWNDKNILGKYQPVDFEKPSTELAGILEEHYRIEVSISEEYSDEQIIKWKVRIKDKGIGLDKAALSFLQKIGSSNKNIKKQELIDSMPFWLRPSGAFGIGFQSIFLITENVKIESKSFYSGEAIIVEVSDPNKCKAGNILIKTEPESYKLETGTVIEFFIEGDTLPSNFTYSLSDKSITAEINNYDFIDKKPLNIEMLKLITKVSDFAENSYIPLKLNFKNDDIACPNLDANAKGYIHPSGFRINIIEYINQKFNNQKFNNQRFHSRLLFKGQPLETKFSTSFCCFDIDILDYKANEILEINRNKVKKEKQADLFKAINNALVDYVATLELTGLNDNEFRDAFVISTYDVIDFIKPECNLKYKLQLPLYSDGAVINDILEASKVCINIRKYDNSASSQQHSTVITKENNGYSIVIDRNYSDELINLLLGYLCAKHFKGVKFSYKQDESDEVGSYTETQIIFSKEDTLVIDRKMMSKIISTAFIGERWPRLSFFCPDEFIKLAVKPEKIGFCERLNHYIHHRISYPPLKFMVLPFKSGDMTYSPFNVDKLIDWTYENRLELATTKDEIEGGYKRYLAYIQELMSEQSSN